ncbi:DUF6527 family protein [Rhodococcoides fascians]|uniref:DUF6527 family protein n=2 Tax=Mycobacteriales TaxID=85007 RepID=UPI00068B8010
MRSGVLYVSITYRTTGHMCCCGCGEEVIAPLAPAQWSLVFDGETVSMYPSIGNWSLKCRSHYVIRRNQVMQRRQFTAKEIADNRAEDRAAIEKYDRAQLNCDTPHAASGEPWSPRAWVRGVRRWFA